MSVSKTDSSYRPPVPKPEPKPVEAPKPQAPTAQAQQPARNEAAPQTTKDGFDAGATSTTRSQQAEKLGATSTTPAGGPADAGALAKVGLTKDDLVKAGQAAAPHLEKAAKAAVDGKYDDALGHLRSAALASPEVAQKAIQGLAKNLPDGPAKSLLSDAKVAKELVTNNELHKTIGKLIDNPLDKGALRELVNNDKARDAALGALGNDPTIKSQLAKVGLEPKDLVQAGKAAPKILDAFDKIQKGDIKAGLTDFQKAVESAPDLAAKLGNKLVEKLPQGVKDQFNKLGITPEQLKTAGPALPHLYEAADAASKGEWAKAYGSIKDAAAAAPDLATQALKGLAKQLPDSLGAAKSLLTDDKFLKELVTNKPMQGSLEKIFKGDTSGFRELLGNDKARDAALTAIGKDPGVKAALDKVGLTPEDLKQAGAAAPKLWDAFDKIQKGDIKAGLQDFQKAVEAAPDLAAKLGNRLIDKLPQGIKDQFNKLGITPEQLKTAGPALPHLYEAADAAVKGDWGKAYSSIKDAAAAAPDLATQAFKGLAKQLPDSLGAAKTLLTDDKFLKELVTNKGLQGSLEKLVKNPGDTGALRELLHNDKARDATLGAIGNDPAVKASLAKVGLTPEDLVDAGKAAPKILDAFDKIQKGDIKGGLQDFQKAVESAPRLAAKLGEKLINGLPQGIKDQFSKLGITPEALKTAGPALPHLFDAADAASKGEWGKAVNSLKEAAISAPDLTAQALKGIANQLPDQLGPVKTLLTDEKFLKEMVSNRDVHSQVGKLFDEKTRMEGLRGLLGNDKVRDAALGALGNDPAVKSALEKVGLTPEDLKEAGKAAPHVFDAVKAFSEGKLDQGIAALGKAVEEAPNLANKLGEKLVSKLPEGVRKAITDLGISPSDLAQAGKALPDLFKAGQALSQGDFQQAFTSLKDAAGKMPPAIVEKAITTAASKLPDNAFGGLAKSLLTNKDFVHQLVTNKDLHASFDKMMKGEFTQGLREMLGNKDVRKAAAGALATNKDFMDKLKPFGIENAADLEAVGGAAFDVLEAGKLLAEGKGGEALKTLGRGLADVPPDLRAKMVGKLADKLGVPDWARDTLTAAVGLLGNEEVGQALGDAFSALKKGDIGGFVAGVANTGKTIAETAPETAKAFLNSLGNIPGSLGELFSDEQLNAAMVDSGAAANMFSAAEKLARGDVGGALNEIASAGMSLLTQGDHFEVAGQELPFGQQGIDNMTRLFGRFVDALPDKLKAEITEKAATFAAKAGLKSVPVLGNIASGVSALGSAKDLWDALKEDPKDPIKVALSAGQLGLDVAGMVPGLNSIIAPLQMVLGTATVLKGAADLIGDVGEFQRSLVGG
jgi:hypothetical protein